MLCVLWDSAWKRSVQKIRYIGTLDIKQSRPNFNSLSRRLTKSVCGLTRLGTSG
jgi:hypothetical protein